MDIHSLTQKVWELLQVRLFEVAGTPISVATIASVAMVVAVTLYASRLLQNAVTQAFRLGGDHQEGTRRAATRLVHYVTLLVGFGVVIQTMGIDLGALFAAGAIFAVGLGFAMQSIAQNFVSGVILLVERSIKPGDILELDGQIVKVVEMGIRATIVETRDGENLIVPNSGLIQSTVKNFTLGDQSYRIRLPVGVVYGADMDKVMGVLQAVAQDMTKHWAVQGRAPIVLMTGFGDNSVNFEVCVWTTAPWTRQLALSELHKAVWDAFKAHEIVIAFPQLDLHLDEPALRALGGAASEPDTKKL